MLKYCCNLKFKDTRKPHVTTIRKQVNLCVRKLTNIERKTKYWLIGGYFSKTCKIYIKTQVSLTVEVISMKLTKKYNKW